MPKIREILLKLGGFKYAQSMYLNMGYYQKKKSKDTSNICMIIIPWENYRYKHLPIGVSNFLEIFQGENEQNVTWI